MPKTPIDMMMDDVQAREVEWYRRHGQYPERICRTRDGREYVEGDWSWERSHPHKAEPIEWRMQLAGVYRRASAEVAG